jgi:hypothetical protein
MRNSEMRNCLYSEIRIRNSEFRWACSSVWLERTPDKREVDGSTPSRPTTEVKGQARNSISCSSGHARRSYGGVAQLGERLPCTQEVIGSNPFTSTKYQSVDLSGGTRQSANPSNAFLNSTFTLQYTPCDVKSVQSILGII